MILNLLTLWHNTNDSDKIRHFKNSTSITIDHMIKKKGFRVTTAKPTPLNYECLIYCNDFEH